MKKKLKIVEGKVFYIFLFIYLQRFNSKLANLKIIKDYFNQDLKFLNKKKQF